MKRYEKMTKEEIMKAYESAGQPTCKGCIVADENMDCMYTGIGGCTLSVSKCLNTDIEKTRWQTCKTNEDFEKMYDEWMDKGGCFTCTENDICLSGAECFFNYAMEEIEATK